MMARWHRRCRRRLVASACPLVGIGERSAVGWSHRLDDLIDPEDPLGAAGGIPRRRRRCCRCWPSAEPGRHRRRRGSRAVRDPAPRTVIGVAGDGVVDIDLVRDGPHALMAGTTGAGKSELLRSLVAGLAVALQPRPPDLRADRLQGRLDVRRLRRRCPTWSAWSPISTTTSPTARCVSLHAELRRREQLLRAARRRRPAGVPARRARRGAAAAGRGDRRVRRAGQRAARLPPRSASASPSAAAASAST